MVSGEGNYGIIIFHTTTSAIHSEKVLKKEGFEVKLIPTPRELSSDCGIALKFDWQQSEKIQSILDKSKIEISSIHKFNQSK